MSLTGGCPIDNFYGVHMQTIEHDRATGMTYYVCMNCGKRKERGIFLFHGKERLKPVTLEARVSALEKELEGLRK